MKKIDYETAKGNLYRIQYRLCGLFNWEWDILLYSPGKANSSWLGMCFGRDRTLFPNQFMSDILRRYAEYKDHKDGDANR